MNQTTLQGSFRGTGSDVYLSLRSGVNWIKVINLTATAQTAANYGREFWWQSDMPQNSQIVTSNIAGFNTLQSNYSTDGFTYYDSSLDPNATLKNVTAISNLATPPVVTSNGHGYNTGDVVRMYTTAGAEQLGGIDFHVTRLNANTFSLTYSNQIAVAGTVGTCRRIKYDPIFYPRNRTITNITQAAQAVVTLSVTHQYTVGQQIRFGVPTSYGMVELDGQTATIVARNTTTNTITVDIDTTAYTAFTFPVPGDLPFTPAFVSPFGESLTTTHDLADATQNFGEIGMLLKAGDLSPAGRANDSIIWLAGTTFNG